jgi:hypothetical protein
MLWYLLLTLINGKEGFMKSIRMFGILFFIITISGCATLPSTSEMKAEILNYQLPQTPQEGKAIVYVVRPSQLGTLIRFNVFLDDQEDISEMGYTRGAQYIYFTVAPGDHKVYSKAENWAELEINTKAGDVMFIQQDPVMGIVMARNNIIRLDDVTGKYHIKTLSLGTIIKTEK